MRGLVLANAYVSSDVNFFGSVSCPHLGESTVVYAGNKSSPKAEVRLGHCTVSCKPCGVGEVG